MASSANDVLYRSGLTPVKGTRSRAIVIEIRVVSPNFIAECFSHGRGPTPLQLRRPLAFNPVAANLRTMPSSRQPKMQTAHVSWTTLHINVNPVSYVLGR
jgi:hypothetical protein